MFPNRMIACCRRTFGPFTPGIKTVFISFCDGITVDLPAQLGCVCLVSTLRLSSTYISSRCFLLSLTTSRSDFWLGMYQFCDVAIGVSMLSWTYNSFKSWSEFDRAMHTHHPLRSTCSYRSSSRAKVADAASGAGEPSDKVGEFVDDVWEHFGFFPHCKKRERRKVDGRTKKTLWRHCRTRVTIQVQSSFVFF